MSVGMLYFGSGTTESCINCQDLSEKLNLQNKKTTLQELKIINLQQTNYIHEARISNLEQDIQKISLVCCDLKTKYEKITETLSARQIAILAESKLIKYIFPKATKSIFSIRSLSNLMDFIKNPIDAENKNKCMPGSAEAWEKIDIEQRQIIINKTTQLKEKHPKLVHCIKELKQDGNRVAHTMTNFSQTLEYFRKVDEDIAELLEECEFIFQDSWDF
jgi:hypothetical protein